MRALAAVMDHLVREIKENLKLGAAPPPPTPQLQTEPSPPPHHSPSAAASSGGKMKGSRGGWGVRHRASPYHVPPPAPRVPSVSDSSAGAADHPTPESMAALRKKWASGRRRYPSTCMNTNAAAAAAAKNIDPDDPFAILQVYN